MWTSLNENFSNTLHYRHFPEKKAEKPCCTFKILNFTLFLGCSQHLASEILSILVYKGLNLTLSTMICQLSQIWKSCKLVMTKWLIYTCSRYYEINVTWSCVEWNCRYVFFLLHLSYSCLLLFCCLCCHITWWIKIMINTIACLMCFEETDHFSFVNNLS